MRAGHSVIDAADGSATLDLIREHHQHIDVLVLEMAAATLPGRVEHFIRKPYQAADLIDLIEQVRDRQA